MQKLFRKSQKFVFFLILCYNYLYAICIIFWKKGVNQMKLLIVVAIFIILKILSYVFPFRDAKDIFDDITPQDDESAGKFVRVPHTAVLYYDPQTLKVFTKYSVRGKDYFEPLTHNSHPCQFIEGKVVEEVNGYHFLVLDN